MQYSMFTNYQRTFFINTVILKVWSVIESAGGGCLTRNFNGRYPDCVAVMQAILEFSNASKFEDFEYFLHREFHDAVHCVIGGLMCTDNSAAAPEFFLHHGYMFVDVDHPGL